MTGRSAVIRADAHCLPLADSTVDLVITSPPYFALRSYTDGGQHYAGQVGDEATPQEFIDNLLAVTAECVRVLKPTGSLWVNLGDKYASYEGNRGAGQMQDNVPRGVRPRGTGLTGGGFVKAKSLMGLPWRYALGCIDQLGLILRAEVVWSKPNGLPESVTDRVRRSHEQFFHFVKEPRYYSAVDEIREPHLSPITLGRRIDGGAPENGGGQRFGADGTRHTDGHPLGKLPSSVWSVPTAPLQVPAHLGVDHFAAFPPEWPRRIILGWSPSGACEACGQGRRPVVDKRLVNVWHDKPAEQSRHLGTREQHQHNLYGVKQTYGSTEATITGYACACPDTTAPTRPAVVADVFGGTGTTAMVARALGRTGLSFDLSHDYSRLARWRTEDAAQRAKVRGEDFRRPEQQLTGQLGMFEETA